MMDRSIFVAGKPRRGLTKAGQVMLVTLFSSVIAACGGGNAGEDLINDLLGNPVTQEDTVVVVETAPIDPLMVDSDNDGTFDVLDCAPNDPTIFPGAVDNPNDGIDSNCDGLAETVNPVVDGIEFINLANGAVTEITDSEDATTVSVVQTVPVLDDGVASSVDTPITLFFNDKLFLDSLFNNIVVLQNGVQVPGSVTITESSAGFAILTFLPQQRYQEGSSVTLTLNGGTEGVLDDGGNTLNANSGDNFEIALTTVDANVQAFDSNLSFESSDEGVIFTGDGAVVTSPIGCLAANEGSNFAAITTGNTIVSGGFAVGETSSTMQLGPINLNANQNTISFDYNFVSAEFNEFVGSIFDDSAVVSISGPNGSVTNILTTVNLVGVSGNTECTGIPQLLTGGGDGFEDSYAGQTGWTMEAVNIATLGSPVFITFTVTDVEDDNLSTILAIDNIQF